MSRKTISERLVSRLAEFRDEKLFNDVILVSNGEEHPCSRISLAQQCQWFCRKFIENPLAVGEVMRLELPVNPSNIIGTFLDVLLRGKVVLTLENLPLLLKMAVFYEAPKLADVLRYFVRQTVLNVDRENGGERASMKRMLLAGDKQSTKLTRWDLNNERLLYFMREFAHLGLTEDALALTPFVTEHFVALIMEQKSEETRRMGKRSSSQKSAFTMQEIYDSVPPHVMAAMVTDPRLYGPSGILAADDVVGIIDEFVRHWGTLTDNDREALARVIDWEDISAFQHIVLHRCDWLPDRHYRMLVKRVLDKRRGILRDMGKVTRKCPEQIPKWYVYSWFTAIRNVSFVRPGMEPEVNLIHFFRTLGGATKFAHPWYFGFLDIVQMGRELAPQFGAGPWFLPGAYWMARAEDGVAPVFAFDLKGNDFVVSEVSCDTVANTAARVTGNEPLKHAPKPRETCVTIQAGSDRGTFFDPKRNHTQSLALTDGKIEHCPVDIRDPVSVIGLKFPEKSTNGFDIVRLTEFELLGRFVCKGTST